MSNIVWVLIILLSFGGIFQLDYSGTDDAFHIACENQVPSIPNDCFQHRMVGSRCCFKNTSINRDYKNICQVTSEQLVNNTVVTNNFDELASRFNLTCPVATVELPQPFAELDTGVISCQKVNPVTIENCNKVIFNGGQCCYTMINVTVDNHPVYTSACRTYSNRYMSLYGENYTKSINCDWSVVLQKITNDISIANGSIFLTCYFLYISFLFSMIMNSW